MTRGKAPRSVSAGVSAFAKTANASNSDQAKADCTRANPSRQMVARAPGKGRREVCWGLFRPQVVLVGARIYRPIQRSM